MPELVFAVVDGTGPVLLLSADLEVDAAVVVAAAVDGTVEEGLGVTVGTVRHVLEAEAEIVMSVPMTDGSHPSLPVNERHPIMQFCIMSVFFFKHMQIWS